MLLRLCHFFDKRPPFCLVLFLGLNSTVVASCLSIDCTYSIFVFRLLQMGLTLLQGEILPNNISKGVLRERVYNTALDFYA